MTRSSWGNFPRVQQSVRRVDWLSDTDLNTANEGGTLLPYAYGRSYGDSCLNDGGTLLDVSGAGRLIGFDPATGVVRAEAGMSLAQLLEFAVPRGFFLPVTPGTKYVSLGGAVANDIHGKNHHRAGTFGRHVQAFELLRSDGSRSVCSRTENPELFAAAVGGLGLTGLVTWVELTLRPVQSAMIEGQNIKFAGLDEFFEISAESDAAFEYTVAWVDCMAKGKSLGRGIFMLGNHATEPGPLTPSPPPRLTAPFDAPNFALNHLTIGAFNALYYGKQRQKQVAKHTHYEPFFYPLDAVNDWNRIYGPRGFLQYQFALPYSGDASLTKEIFSRIAASSAGKFLAVLKMFGDLPSPGMLSFPVPGVTLALDFPNEGQKTFALLDDLDALIRQGGGRVYPAKDARMSGESFRTFFPGWREFSQYIDPAFSSSFWRRVTEGAPADVEVKVEAQAERQPVGVG